MIQVALQLQHTLQDHILDSKQLPQQLLAQIQTAIFRCRICNNLEDLHANYIQSIQLYIDSLTNNTQQMEILIKLIYYLGYFLNDDQSKLYSLALTLIKNQIIDKNEIVYESRYLDVVKACGSKNVKIKQKGDWFVFLSNTQENEYFLNKFLRPYISNMIENVPQNDIEEYVRQQKDKIYKLHQSSQEYVMNELIKYIIEHGLRTIDYNNIRGTIKLFKFIEIQDQAQYIKGKTLQNLLDSINPMISLAMNYKNYLKQQGQKNTFQSILTFFKETNNYIDQQCQGQRHLKIVLYELIEEYVGDKDYSNEIINSKEIDDIGIIVSCFNQTIDKTIQMFLLQLYKTESPYQSNYNYQQQLNKLEKIQEHQQNYIQKMQLIELKQIMQQFNSQKQMNKLIYLPYPLHLSQTFIEIDTLPIQLQNYIKPEQNCGLKCILQDFGYGILTYKQKYTLILNTIQMITLLNIENQKTDNLDQKALSELQESGLVIGTQINDYWESKCSTIVLIPENEYN